MEDLPLAEEASLTGAAWSVGSVGVGFAQMKSFRADHRVLSFGRSYEYQA